MLDEKLPTFVKKTSSDKPGTSIVYLSQDGDEPSPEYILKRPNPALAVSRNKYAVGLMDSFSQDVAYGEVLVEPEWSRPSLSAAELRTNNGHTPPPTPTVPVSFAIQLYNPDQQVAVKHFPGSWNSKDTWEFDMPEQTFRLPSASTIDRDRERNDPVASERTPKIMFRWKRDGRLSKDMTCYMTGKSVGGRKSKEPDITVALLKQHRNTDTALTVYEPNMKRVQVEDRKGLDIVFVLGAEVIRDLYLSPGPDPFNIASGATSSGSAALNTTPIPSRRRPGAGAGAGAETEVTSMSGTLSAYPSSHLPPAKSSGSMPPVADLRKQWEIDAETKRLQAVAEKEERERKKQQAAEEKRIKKILEEEENKQRQKKAEEIAKETERLRKLYGVEGQNY